MPLDSHGSEVIDQVGCRALLHLAAASRKVGRLAISREGSSPFLIPVNFSVSDESILIRLRPGFAAHHLDGATITFEIDHSEPYAKSGWSVVVEGTARLLTHEEVARLGGNVPHPIVLYPGMRVFSIRSDRMTGRTIRHDLEGEAQDAYSRTNPTIKGDTPMDLHLDEPQVIELHSLLTHALGDLSSEIADTDNPTFQRMLRARRQQLQSIVQQIDSTPVV